MMSAVTRMCSTCWRHLHMWQQLPQAWGVRGRDQRPGLTGRVPPPRVMQSMEKAESPMADADRMDMMDMKTLRKAGQCSGNVAAAEAITKWFMVIFATTTSTGAACPPSASVSFVTAPMTTRTPRSSNSTKIALTPSLSLQRTQL